MKHTYCWLAGVIMLGWAAGLALPVPLYAQADDATPPAQTVKLIFIHHSTGGMWLADDYGGLGKALMQNNYYVSATNYGWGPDGIGDRTDIPNWPEWFTGPERNTILNAVYNETEQSFGDYGAWTRLPDDPGGENEIIVFKSCFPNSELGGQPNDPPAEAPNEEYSVSNAKAVYNNILTYFATRPDKLFVVITAPPVQNPELAANARAFNNWLVNNWLSENNYALNNVAVFDFYNILTGANNHHRWQNGAVEHVINDKRNTLFYPSDDDHPSTAGSRKAATEFVPLLNVFYNRWKANAPASVPTTVPEVDASPAPAEATPPPVVAPPPTDGNLIDDFEAGPPEDTAGWWASFDESTKSRISCDLDNQTAHGGKTALRMEFDVPPNGWGICDLSYSAARNWQAMSGLSFYLRATQAGLIYHLDVYGGTPDNRATYYYAAETPPESVNGWARVEVTWDQILRAEWEADGGAPVDPAQVIGLAFGFVAPEEGNSVGTIWVDDIQFLGAETVAPEEATPKAPAATEPPPDNSVTPPAPAPTAKPAGGGRICGGAALPLALIGLAGSTQIIRRLRRR